MLKNIGRHKRTKEYLVKSVSDTKKIVERSFIGEEGGVV